MNRDQFWLTDTQFSKIKPHLPTDTRNKRTLLPICRTTSLETACRYSHLDIHCWIGSIERSAEARTPFGSFQPSQ